MWTPSLLIGVLIAARVSASQQLPFVAQPAHHEPSSSSLSPANSLSSDDISTAAETIVSTLSASDQHMITLHLLQRAKCIPMLAHISASTVFAPTDQAWTQWADKHKPSVSSEALAYGWLGHDGLNEWMEEEEDVLQLRTAVSGDEEAERRSLDNQNWALRQLLLYHMLNYTLPPSAFLPNVSSNITVETTLLYPLAQEPELPPTPEPGPPWLPRGGEGLLHGRGQRLRIAAVGSPQGGDSGKIGTDWAGDGGANVWDGSGWERKGNKTEGRKEKDKKGAVKGMKWVRNGVVVGIDQVLDMPPSIEEIIRTHPSLSYLSHLLSFGSLPTPLPDSFTSSPHLTVFAPSNEAFANAFDDVEKAYLEGPYGDEGVSRIVAGGVVPGIGKGNVGWSDAIGNRTVEAASGLLLDIASTGPGALAVNGTDADAVDIFASNGVIHIMPNLLLPENFTLLNSAEKMLLSLNATRFVSLLRSANISDRYIGGAGKNRKDAEPWTILAPTDDVLDAMDRGGWGAPLPDMRDVGAADIWQALTEGGQGPLASRSLKKPPTQDASPLAALLQYHILPGRLMPSDIESTMLLGTELRTSSLGGARQRLRVDVSERFKEDRHKWDAIEAGEIRFGGATVLGKPVKSGNSIIYLISSLLSPPDDVLQTAVSDLQLSTFIAAVYAAELEKAVKRTPATTYFMPRNRAFGQLGLAMKYLLLPEAKDELRKVVKYHAVSGIIYTHDVEVGQQILTTLEGGKVVLQRTKGKNGTLALRSPTHWDGYDSGDDLPSNGELRPAAVWHKDALTSTGVIHTIDSVIMPADVRISVGKLVRGSRQATMGDLMQRAGLGWILEGREPTMEEVQRVQLDGRVRMATSAEGDEADQPDMEDLALPSYTVLVPTDKAFSGLNLTHYLEDREALLALLKLHIIPSSSAPSTRSNSPISVPRDGHPISLQDDLVYSTLLSGESKYGDIAFRATGDNSYIVGIRGARGGDGQSNSARIGQTGRASVRWKSRAGGVAAMKKHKHGGGAGADTADESQKRLWKGGMTLGGGVIMIDQVLIPYQASWFSRWGWLVLTLSGIGLIVVIAAVSFGWWYMTRGREEPEYEPLEGEEEE
ncbi:hypothetical protein IAU60_006256 [Kwoniella sp. DSM 27419]